MMGYRLSYWEKTAFFEDVDICIIGGGLVGLHAAISIKLLAPETDVLILERGFLPYGASTRNAGFACFGSMTELLDDLSRESESDVFARVELRWRGLVRMRELLGDDVICYEPLGGYELFTPEESLMYRLCSDRIQWFNARMQEITGVPETYKHADHAIGPFGFAGTQHLILNSLEGQLDTGMMMTALEHKARSLGVRIISGINIEAVEGGSAPEVHTDKGFPIRPDKILVTVNGFARKLLPGIDVTPARAQVLITEPVEGLKFRGSFHYDKGYYYFRNVGNRILFGGGRNLDFEGESTTEFGLTDTIQQKLDTLLKEVILPSTPFKTDMRWSGIMGMGPDRKPVVREIEKNLYCAVRMGGMGVAIGSMIGEQAAELVGL